MRILQVIHGYPPRYNAGSEVYTQTLTRALAERHDMHVFTRGEDPFAPDFAVTRERDANDERIALHVVNTPRSRDRYREAGVDQRFAELLETLRPDVVHVGHLNHLSTSVVLEASARAIPVVFTLHDYWLMCPRGQFVQTQAADAGHLWPSCDGQHDRRCAERCYSKFYSGAAADAAADLAHWEAWVARRMRHAREIAAHVDVFVAPSGYLARRFVEEFGLPPEAVTYVPYGFDRARLTGRRRVPGEPFTFGYIGTHIPAKGVHLLLAAFGSLGGEARLRIWGRPRAETEALRAIAARLPGDAGTRVEWLPEYRNADIVRTVFDRVDAIVVPSIWVENAPLVIHEAQQARVPVITGDVGGMAELVQHEVNGLLFAFRDPLALAAQMQRFVDEPGLSRRLGERGYLHDPLGDVPAVEAHVAEIERIYERVRGRRASARVEALPGPWRITFDTNPDTCNLRCVMCEEHSPHSPKQVARRAAGRPRRLMPIDLLRRTFAEAAPNGLREVIPSTMGEPLLYEHFDAIVDLCAEHGVKLNLTTNGTFPGRGARAWAERVVPVGSDVKISWNGATAATHEAIMLGTRWDHVLANVRTFVAVRDAHALVGGNRCRVTFQLTFLESNVAELGDVVALAASLGVDRVKGAHRWSHFDEITALSMRRSPEAIARWNRAVLRARDAADAHRLPTGERVLLENFFLLDEATPSDIAPGGPCPFLGQEAWVSAEGRFDPCCAPDAHRRALGEFGNLHNAGLVEIWRGDAYRGLVAGYATRPLCRGCNMRRPATPAVNAAP